MYKEPLLSSSYFRDAKALVSHFDPVSLNEMDEVKLLDRTDMKFILPFERLESILGELKDDYRVLTLDGENVFKYRTKYFDTPELVMFYDHHNGKLNRFKVRNREYIESQLSFLEVKFRSNKGRVIKKRIQDWHTDKQLFTGFVTEHTPYNPAKLQCTVVNQFNRFTLVDRQMQERVTTDFNLSYSKESRSVSLNGLVIIEIKQNQADKESLFYRILKKHYIRPSSISKYCIGMSLLNNKPKANNFKEILLKIYKVSHVEHTT